MLSTPMPYLATIRQRRRRPRAAASNEKYVLSSASASAAMRRTSSRLPDATSSSASMPARISRSMSIVGKIWSVITTRKRAVTVPPRSTRQDYAFYVMHHKTSVVGSTLGKLRHALQRGVDMGDHGVPGRIDVAGPNGLEQLPVLSVGFVRAAGAEREGSDDVHRRAVLQRLDDPGQSRGVCNPGEHPVEPAVQVDPGRRVVLLVGQPEDLRRLLDVVVGDALDRPLHHLGLEELPDPVDLLQLGLTRLVHNCAAMGIEADQALGGEVAQRLAHRRRADPHLLRQVGLDEAFATRYLPGEDRPPQRVAHQLMSGAALTLVDQQTHEKPSSCSRSIDDALYLPAGGVTPDEPPSSCQECSTTPPPSPSTAAIARLAENSPNVAPCLPTPTTA